MGDSSQAPNAIDAGEPHEAGQFLLLVYEELRRLAAARLARETPGQTLDATALVHEAYLRLVASASASEARGRFFANRAHFFAAAAEAMRRILVDRARARHSEKYGARFARRAVDLDQLAASENSPELIELDEALSVLARAAPRAAEVVKLRYFAGLTSDQAAAALDISPRTADLDWSYARAWLLAHLRGN